MVMEIRKCLDGKKNQQNNKAELQEISKITPVAPNAEKGPENMIKISAFPESLNHAGGSVIASVDLGAVWL